MNDLNKVIELGKQLAEPWKRATKVLSLLLVLTVLSLIFVVYNGSYVDFDASYNNNSEITQSKD